MVEAKGAYQKQLQAENFTERGKLKAATRSEERMATLEEMYQVIFSMREVAREKSAELTADHEARTVLKEELGFQVLRHIDEKIDAPDQLMVVDAVAEETESDPKIQGSNSPSPKRRGTP